MVKFLELHDGQTGQLELVNVENIFNIQPFDGDFNNTMIYSISGKNTYIKETVKEIAKMLGLSKSKRPYNRLRP